MKGSKGSWSNIPGAAWMRAIADCIREVLPDGWGFALIVFPFHRPGITNYISTGERESMIKALRETVERLEKKQDFPTPEEN